VKPILRPRGRGDGLISAALIALGLWLLPLWAVAAEPPGAELPDQITRYLQADVFIRPGVGFRSVHIGMPFSAVREAWGTPDRTRRGFSRKWYYKPEAASLIVLHGNKTVQKLIVRGTPGSVFQTLEGVRFGMSPEQIRRVYGVPAGRKRNDKIRYSAQGIAFAFQDDALLEITIQRPK